MEAEQFKTFLQPKDIQAPRLDIHKIMLRVIEEKPFSMSDFWNMPLSLVLEVLGLFTPPEKLPMSRYRLIRNEQRVNVRYGHV